MKKVLAILLTVLMICSLSVPAWAAKNDAQTMTELNWTEVEEQIKEAGIEGDFVAFDEIAVKMWMPSVFQAVELDDEEKEDGAIACYMTEDEDAIVYVIYEDVDSATLEDMQEYVKEEYGVKDAEIGLINGLRALVYTIEAEDEDDSDVLCVDFETEAGYMLDFNFSPAEDEDFLTVAYLMLYSIQPTEG